VGLLGDFNLAKFTIPISIQKSFDKGEIEKVYQKMYRVADELSHEDARKYLLKKSTRYKELKYLNPEKNLESSSISSVFSQAHEYMERRFKIHMDNMIHILELYVESKRPAEKQQLK
jgi:hypothetical protein